MFVIAVVYFAISLIKSVFYHLKSSQYSSFIKIHINENGFSYMEFINTFPGISLVMFFWQKRNKCTVAVVNFFYHLKSLYTYATF
jgi:hypothetical protein